MVWGSKSPSAAPYLLPTPDAATPSADDRHLIDSIPTVPSQVTAACPVFSKGVRTPPGRSLSPISRRWSGTAQSRWSKS